MYFIIVLILITELITVSNGGDNYCMSDCNCNCNCQASRNEQPSRYEQPSLYEQHCCNLTNIGNTIKFRNGKLRTFIICPSNLPNSCFQFYNYASCLQIHQVFLSATSGYYNITLMEVLQLSIVTWRGSTVMKKEDGQEWLTST